MYNPLFMIQTLLSVNMISSNFEAFENPNYEKILKKCFVGTTYIVTTLACLNFQPQ